MSLDELAEQIIRRNGAHRSSRRQLLRQMAGVSLGVPLTPWNALLAQAAAEPA